MHSLLKIFSKKDSIEYFLRITLIDCLYFCQFTYIYIHRYRKPQKKLSFCFLFRVKYFLCKQRDSYFGNQSIENPFLHTWFLSIEMQFYLISPFAIYFFKNHLNSISLVVIFTISITTSSIILLFDQQQVVYFLLISRISDFFYRCFSCFIFSQIKNHIHYLTTIYFYSQFIINYFLFFYFK